MSITVTFTLLSGESEQSYFFNTAGLYTVGRDENSSLSIPASIDQSISRYHCNILLTENSVFIRDIGSSNGTFVNDQQLVDGSSFSVNPTEVPTDVEVGSEDTLKVGNSVFKIEVKNRETVEQVTPVIDIDLHDDEIIDEIIAEPTKPEKKKKKVKSSSPFKMSSASQSPQRTVKGWIIPPPKTKNKRLIRINNV